MVVGVSEGYKKELEINGVGYRAAKEGKQARPEPSVTPTPLRCPRSTASPSRSPRRTRSSFTACDKQKVGQFAAEVREKRPPEPYKGKGIKYADEVIRRKVGKTGAKK